jgi:hypothetical protein
LTAFSKSPRENSFNTCEKMLHTLYIGRAPEVELVLFRNPIQRIRGSAFHWQRHPLLRPAVSLLIWTAVIAMPLPKLSTPVRKYRDVFSSGFGG